MLADLNIWFDVVFWLGLIGILLGLLGVYVPANIIGGRLQDRFLRNKWWYLEAMHAPLPEEYANVVLQRTWHWVNLVSFLAFFVSGFYIRYPFYDGGREFMRNLHLFFAYINIVNYLVRVGWTITGQDRNNFTFDKSDIKTFIENLKYYTFFAGSYPHEKKFHPMQRMTYIMMALLFPIMIYSGAALIWPGLFASWMGGLFGGEAGAVAAMRLLHGGVFRLYLIIVIAHGVLGIGETFPTLKFLWFGIHIPQELKHGHGHGDDDHGHSDHGEDNHGHGKHEEVISVHSDERAHGGEQDSRPEAAF